MCTSLLPSENSSTFKTEIFRLFVYVAAVMGMMGEIRIGGDVKMKRREGEIKNRLNVPNPYTHLVPFEHSIKKVDDSITFFSDSQRPHFQTESMTNTKNSRNTKKYFPSSDRKIDVYIMLLLASFVVCRRNREVIFSSK